MSEPAAAALIARLGLQPHPEGGWYRETWRSPAAPGARAGASAILFLLEAHQSSRWHRVDAAELWLWHAGAAIELALSAGNAGPETQALLGADILAGQMPQVLVPAGHWQAAWPLGGWALVSCVVSPAFEFAGFELAPPDWTPGT